MALFCSRYSRSPDFLETAAIDAFVSHMWLLCPFPFCLSVAARREEHVHPSDFSGDGKIPIASLLPKKKLFVLERSAQAEDSSRSW